MVRVSFWAISFNVSLPRQPSLQRVMSRRMDYEGMRFCCVGPFLPEDWDDTHMQEAEDETASPVRPPDFVRMTSHSLLKFRYLRRHRHC